MEKICFLLYGHRGWIGGMVCKLLENLGIRFVRGNAKVHEMDSVRQEIEKYRPTHIFSVIGRTHGVRSDGTRSTTIDYLEEKGKLHENIRDNLYAPMVLALLTKDSDIHFTYLGTGCIFEYDENHPVGDETVGFTETDVPNFFGSSYSVTKGFTDQLFHLLDEHTLNLRIRMPIVDEMHERNFITKITSYDRICSVPNSMTVLDELLPLAIEMACQKKTGTVNLTNPGVISHNEILELYREIVNPDFIWKNFSVEEQNKILASGRSNNHLITTQLQTLFPSVKTIRESVKDTLHRMKHKITNL